jgi:hypothetical protein
MSPETIEKTSESLFEKIKTDLGLRVEILGELELGLPISVMNMDLEPSYWFSPIMHGGKILAFIRMSKDGKLMSYGIYPAGIPAGYLEPGLAEEKIRESFDGEFTEIGCPVLVHDGPPGRMTWMTTGMKERQHTYLFWPFNTAYSRVKKELEAEFL